MRLVTCFFFFTLFTLGLQARKPNVVLIMADDLGYTELGCYGQTKIKTPHLDKLAAGGMKFTAAYAGNAVCAPSRCVLMTGKHPGHAHVRNNSEVKPEGQGPIPCSEVTIAEILKEHGYATAAFGKWGLGGPATEGDPINQGFDHFFGYNCQRHAHSYYPDYLWSDDKRISLDNNPPVPGHALFPKGADPSDPTNYKRFQGKDYAPDRINKQALQFVRDNKDKPFFLYYPTIIPHVALHVPDEELKPYLDLKWEDPPFTKAKGYGYTPHFTPRAAYAAMITRMDRYLGNVFNLLDELGIREDTLILFTSDNGTTHLKDEVDYDFFESVKPLRGLKGSLYEGGVRVPFIANWPGKIQPGNQSPRRIGSEDCLPTILDVLGLQPPPNIDGISFAPTILGKCQDERPFLYREFTGYGGQQALWKGKWKAVRQDMLRKNNPDPLKIELYDLDSDISESHDLSGKHPDLVKEMAALMAGQHVPSSIFPFPVLDK